MIKSQENDQAQLQCALASVLSAILVFTGRAGAQTSAKPSDILVIDASAPAHPFPHFWEHMFGSGRANLTSARKLPQ